MCLVPPRLTASVRLSCHRITSRRQRGRQIQSRVRAPQGAGFVWGATRGVERQIGKHRICPHHQNTAPWVAVGHRCCLTRLLNIIKSLTDCKSSCLCEIPCFSESFAVDSNLEIFFVFQFISCPCVYANSL